MHLLTIKFSSWYIQIWIFGYKVDYICTLARLFARKFYTARILIQRLQKIWWKMQDFPYNAVVLRSLLCNRNIFRLNFSFRFPTNYNIRFRRNEIILNLDHFYLQAFAIFSHFFFIIISIKISTIFLSYIKLNCLNHFIEGWYIYVKKLKCYFRVSVTILYTYVHIQYSIWNNFVYFVYSCLDLI